MARLSKEAKKELEFLLSRNPDLKVDRDLLDELKQAPTKVKPTPPLNSPPTPGQFVNDVEQRFYVIWQNLGGWELQYQVRPVPNERYTVDFYDPVIRVALEVDGGIWIEGGGGHNRGAHYVDDRIRDNLLMCHGIRLFRFAVPKMISPFYIQPVMVAMRNWHREHLAQEPVNC